MGEGEGEGGSLTMDSMLDSGDQDLARAVSSASGRTNDDRTPLFARRGIKHATALFELKQCVLNSIQSWSVARARV